MAEILKKLPHRYKVKSPYTTNYQPLNRQRQNTKKPATTRAAGFLSHNLLRCGNKAAEKD
ncbi:hypothetical protein [Marinobacterium lacunae]|uniref:hypothetical protein n=1 Tax=Marinobacterium lacunae TaxID=1232683 RepID=UPI0012DDE07A|nr:hypothetical protein [Marinobacterium lacunae]